MNLVVAAMSELNPYSSPGDVPDDPIPERLRSGLTVSAECLDKTWLTRAIALTGDVTAIVRYVGWGSGERVYVNEVLMATSSVFQLHVVAPRIDFRIDCGEETLPAFVLVHASWFQFFRLNRFALYVDDVLVYSDP